jgi:ubiquinone/menaquinone biosynthesis C-methylase UbiE
LNVTISNVAGGDPPDVRPYRWAVEDAEQLTCPDGSYDLIAVSAGLHHCRSPHRALLEMYRAAGSAVFVLESRDSMLRRSAIRLGAVDEYERRWWRTALPGGVNGEHMNYVYR